jgi:hypothetical protein
LAALELVRIGKLRQIGVHKHAAFLGFFGNEIGCRRLNGRPKEKYPRKQLSEK